MRGEGRPQKKIQTTPLPLLWKTSVQIFRWFKGSFVWQKFWHWVPTAIQIVYYLNQFNLLLTFLYFLKYYLPEFVWTLWFESFIYESGEWDRIKFPLGIKYYLNSLMPDFVSPVFQSGFVHICYSTKKAQISLQYKKSDVLWLQFAAMHILSTLLWNEKPCFVSTIIVWFI